jgi:putative glutamine amidotransferase
VKPLVGITGRRLAAGSVLSYHPRFHDMHIDVYWSDNGRRVLEAGGIPVLLPFESADSGVIDRLDALLVTGGQDVHPDLWGGNPAFADADADPRRDANVHDRERDEYEIALVRAAVERRLPVLGICRGHQVLNVALGGTLVEDITIDGIVHAAEEPPPTPGHADHIVTFTVDSIAHSIYGGSTQTNSLHHQAVKECGVARGARPGVPVADEDRARIPGERHCLAGFRVDGRRASEARAGHADSRHQDDRLVPTVLMNVVEGWPGRDEQAAPVVTAKDRRVGGVGAGVNVVDDVSTFGDAPHAGTPCVGDPQVAVGVEGDAVRNHQHVLACLFQRPGKPRNAEVGPYSAIRQRAVGPNVPSTYPTRE